MNNNLLARLSKGSAWTSGPALILYLGAAKVALQLLTAAAIFANNYGEAAAIDFFGSKYGLPGAICPQQNYFYWGTRDYTGKSIILLGHNPALERECATEEQAGFVHSEYSMPYENFSILLCHGLKRPLKQVWPGLKMWSP